MRLLTVNAGSSSLKLRLLDDLSVVESADLEVKADDLDPAAVADATADWPQPDAIGHRIVHGGTEFSTAVRIDADVEQRLRSFTDLAPLHQPKSLAGLDAVSEQLPDVPAFACFDTAFHATLPDTAATYAVPAEWRRRGIRRYGFHGLSHAYAARRAVELAGIDTEGSRVITCHLGSGASLCAVRDGRSVDTTMGFTPLEGLVMGTRSGTVDPGMVLWLQQHEQLSVDEVAVALEKQSGLQALAGSADLRQVQAAADDGDADAQLAIDIYLHRLVGAICAMAGSLGGVDVIAFTGGVGENSAMVRRRAAESLDWLGVAIDDRADTASTDEQPDRELTAPGARVRTVVVAAREDLEMAREIAAVR